MAQDTITGIRIDGRTYVEGRRYRGFPLPRFLLDQEPPRGSRVTIDITGNQLTINVVRRGGSLVARFVARGRAVGAAGSDGIADDFTVKQVVESSQTQRSSGSDLQLGRATARSPFSFNQAYRQVTRSSGPLPADTWTSQSVSEQSSSSVVSFSRSELTPELGPFGESFAGPLGSGLV